MNILRVSCPCGAISCSPVISPTTYRLSLATNSYSRENEVDLYPPPLMLHPRLQQKATRGPRFNPHFLPPATKLGQGYVFTRMCDSVHRGEYLTRYPPGSRYTPWTRYTPRTRYTPPDQVHPLPRTRNTPPGPGTPPGTRYTPRDQVHHPQDQVHPPRPVTPPGPGTPQDQVHPLGPGTPPWDQVHPPGTRYTPSLRTRYTPPGTREIRSTRGRYASYWNAFLLLKLLSSSLCKPLLPT